MKINKIKIAFYTIFTLIIIVLSLRPAYNWDMIAYIACSLSLEETDHEIIHRHTYAMVKDQIPEKAFSKLTEGTYRETMLKNSAAFREQIPYYSIRISYVYLVTFLHKLGFSMTMATVIPSLLSMLFLMFIVFEVAYRSIGNALIAGMLTLILIGFPPILKLARLSTPDALSTLILTGIAILYIKNRKWFLIFILMALSIMTRTDTIIWCALLLGIDAVVNAKNSTTSWLLNLFQFMMLVGILFSINHLSENGGWRVIFYNSFIQRMNFPLSETPEFSFGQYLGVLVNSGWYFLSYFLLLGTGLLLIWNKSTLKFLSNKAVIVVLTCILTSVCKFLLFPAVTGRFYFGLLVIGLTAVLLEKNVFRTIAGNAYIRLKALAIKDKN